MLVWESIIFLLFCINCNITIYVFLLNFYFNNLQQCVTIFYKIITGEKIWKNTSNYMNYINQKQTLN